MRQHYKVVEMLTPADDTTTRPLTAHDQHTLTHNDLWRINCVLVVSGICALGHCVSHAIGQGISVTYLQQIAHCPIEGQDALAGPFHNWLRSPWLIFKNPEKGKDLRSDPQVLFAPSGAAARDIFGVSLFVGELFEPCIQRFPQRCYNYR